MKGFFKGLLRKFLVMLIAAGILAGGRWLFGAIGDLFHKDPVPAEPTYSDNLDIQPEFTEPALNTYTFDVGFTVSMDSVLEEQVSELNDFFALGDDGTYAVVANVEPLSDYADLNEYATLSAEANNGQVHTASDGSLYFEYINQEENYHYYTAVRQGSESFYRVSFYCEDSDWPLYEARFDTWAQTLVVN